MKRSY